MEFRVLGPLEVIGPDGAIPVKGAKQRLLLCALLVRPGDAFDDSLLEELLWADAAPAKARNALQAQVSQLRRTVGSVGTVIRQGAGYALELGSATTDAARFDVAVGEARARASDGDPSSAATMLERALAWWRGAPFVDGDGAALFQGTVSRLEELRLVAVEDRIDALLELGRHAEAVFDLEALTLEHPFRERLWCQRMVALYRSGRQADALRAYADARAVLVDELGIEPGPELRRTEALVLAQDPLLAAPTRVEPRGVPRDLAAAPASAGACVPSEASGGPPRLRRALTSFVGRVADIEALSSTVHDHRLVTVVGPGGVGKTRTAMEVGDRLADGFDDGACFVDLAPVVDGADGVAMALAQALGVLEARDPSVPVMGQGLLEQVTSLLGARSVLVVLDNCEHVIAAAARAAEQLLVACPSVRVLATSREPLALPGEAVVPLGPLREHDAEALFIDRVAIAGGAPVGAGDALVADLCSRLDGLPLAIELAAARSRVLSVADLVERLDDRFAVLAGASRATLPRQQTMRAVVDWSYDLLFEDERRLFRQLSVFAGSATFAAVAAVCTDSDLPVSDLVEVLARLVDKSLVVAEAGPDGAMRYRQLQTLKDYAAERLDELEERDAIEERHARWYLQVAIDAEPLLRSGEAPSCRRRLEADLADLRIAFERTVAAGDSDEALRFAVALAWLWFLRSDWLEGRRWLDEALDAGEGSALWRGLALAWSGYFGGFTGVPGEEEPRCHAGSELVRGAGDDERLAESLLLLGSLRVRGGALPGALAVLDEARALLEPAGDGWSLGIVELLTATALLRSGRVDDGTAAADRSIDHLRRVGDPYLMIEALVYRGAAAEAVGDDATMLACYEEAMQLPRNHDAPGYASMTLTRVANAYSLLGRFDEAEELHALAVDLRTSPLTTAFALTSRGVTARRTGSIAAAMALQLQALQLYESLALHDGITGCVMELAWCAFAAGDVAATAMYAARAHRTAARLPDPRPAWAALEGLAAAALLLGRRSEAATLLATAATRREAAGLAASRGEQLDRAAVVLALEDEGDAAASDPTALIDQDPVGFALGETALSELPPPT